MNLQYTEPELRVKFNNKPKAKQSYDQKGKKHKNVSNHRQDKRNFFK